MEAALPISCERQFSLSVEKMADERPGSCDPFPIGTNSNPRVISADRIDGGLIITFDDGRCAVYSASLLFDTFAQAEEVGSAVDYPLWIQA
jgi:hypothetical protein